MNFADKSVSKLGDLTKALRKRAEAVPKRFGRIGRSGASTAEYATVEVVEAAGGRVIDEAAARIGDSHVGQQLDAAAERGIYRVRAFAVRHPVGTVLILAVGAALIQAEFGIGVLAGVGTAVFLVTQTGQSTRIVIATSGKRALASARVAYAKRRRLSPPVLNLA